MNATLHKPLFLRAPQWLVIALLLVVVLGGSATSLRADAVATAQPHGLLELLARETAYQVDSNERWQQQADRLAEVQQGLVDLANPGLFESLPGRLGRLAEAARMRKLQRLQQELADLNAYFDDQRARRDELRQGILRREDPSNQVSQSQVDASFEVLDGISDEKTDFQALLLQDTKTGQTYVVFRGTSSIKDAVADLGGIDAGLPDYELKIPFVGSREIGGIGEQQYEAGRDVLDDWARQHPGSIVVGHSLGAANAQRYVADHPDAVDEAVLFNAPAVEPGTVATFESNSQQTGSDVPITYHQGQYDLVSDFGGQQHLPGTVMVHSGGHVADAGLDFAPHRGDMLQADSGTDCKVVDFDVYQRDRPANDRLSNDKLSQAGAYVERNLSDEHLRQWNDRRDRINTGIDRFNRITEALRRSISLPFVRPPRREIGHVPEFDPNNLVVYPPAGPDGTCGVTDDWPGELPTHVPTTASQPDGDGGRPQIHIDRPPGWFARLTAN